MLIKFIPFSLAIVILIIFIGCQPPQQQRPNESEPITKEITQQIVTQLGDTLFIPIAKGEIAERYDTAAANYETNPSTDNLIWLGRFAAYRGAYDEAIDLFSKGVKFFPDDPRFLRHRGHRYITIRKFDLAIIDLKKASEMIAGTSNEIEPDGMPNSSGIPISSLHGNIWYHLGLAYYLVQDWENALNAYQNCLKAMNNDDNVVSSTNWLYLIERRMGNINTQLLEPINNEMKIIENFAYLQNCLFYKDEISAQELLAENGAASSNDAKLYAHANWYLYNGDTSSAKSLMEQILEKDSWTSFGYIAAEADYAALFN
ncbi:MAG: tetratricopeptide repeat protein [Cyclobacteriaceae bacterium]